MQVERERVVTEDMVRSWDRAEFDRQFRRLEEENQTLQRQVEQLQSVLNESEHQHAQRYVVVHANESLAEHDVSRMSSLIDFTTRNRRENEAETERIRSSQTAAERALEAREKAHRARVKGLEEQVLHSPSTSCKISSRSLDHRSEGTAPSRNASPAIVRQPLVGQWRGDQCSSPRDHRLALVRLARSTRPRSRPTRSGDEKAR